MKTIYMVEDEDLLRELFEEYVMLIPEVEFKGSCGDGREAMKIVLELKPDILILDIRLPEINGLEILLLLRKKLPETKIIIFSGSLDQSTVKMAVDCDADAFVEKAFGLEELKRGIQTVIAGDKYYSPGALKFKNTLI